MDSLWTQGKNWSFPYVVMCRLCKLKTSVNILQHNDITKNQSERLKNIEPRLPRSSSIFKMAAAEEVECVDEHMQPDINELLSEAIRRYPILYGKTLKEFKDRKMKSNAWKRFFLTQSVSCFADFFFAFLLEKTTQWRTSRGASPPFCFLYWTYSNVVM